MVKVTAPVLFGLLGTRPHYAVAGETLDSPIGELPFNKDFENGYPTDETVTKLYDEMDFQRASQA